MQVNSVYIIKHLKRKQTGKEARHSGNQPGSKKRAGPLFEKFKVILPNLGHLILVHSGELSFVGREKANK